MSNIDMIQNQQQNQPTMNETIDYMNDLNWAIRKIFDVHPNSLQHHALFFRSKQYNEDGGPRM